MKRVSAFFAAVLMTLGLSAANYGVLVNSRYYFPGTMVDEFEGFTQYLAHVQLSAGDYCQLCDADNQAVWAVDLNPASVTGFTRNGERYEVTVSGCYDFYIKLKYQADELYIGPGSDCSAGIDTEGLTPPVEDDDVNYYAIGWINGADHGETAYDVYEDEFLFVDGKLTINCQMGSYIALKDHMGNFYYSKTPTTIANESVTMDWANGWSGCEKWAIPEGVNYIIMRKASYKNQIVLERVDKATYDAYHLQGVENTVVSEKAHKMIVNGQLVIIRGEKMFDLTGRQL